MSRVPLRDFSHSLPMALLRAREAVMSRFRPMLRAHGVTEQQWRVLRALEDSGEIEISRLAERSFILMPSLSRILQNLEGRGLITRRAAAADQRRVLVAISPKGLELVGEVAPHSEANYAAIAEAAGEDNIARLYGLLDQVTEALEPPPED
ncbi:MAG: homoprotocatechuate degradation operon regulator HpaR [Rhodospirillales bacterium]|nr:homoprotocatechuate degradation operon regulator HpaR [Rhodospirillales bacterium]